MARPKKVGLNYYPFDIDFFDDEKIVAISGEFGIKGEITAIKLLCAIYRNGYYIEWNEMLQMKMLRSLPGISIDLLKSIVNRLVRWGFFDKTLFDSAQILTSAGIQRRYFSITRSRNQENDNPYIIIENTKKKEDKTTTPQEEPPATQPPPDFVPYTLTLDQEIETLRSQQAWLDQLQLLHHIDVGKLQQLLDDFRLQCLTDGRDRHQSLQDAKQHFNNWLRKVTAKNKKSNNDNNRQKSTPQRRGNILNPDEPKNYGSSF